MKQNDRPTSVPADPEQWSEKSKQTVSYGFIREYTDKPYKCWHCQSECVFTAQDQKYTYEVKKASIDQRRSFCATCWSESNRIRNSLRECEAQWAKEKAALTARQTFSQSMVRTIGSFGRVCPVQARHSQEKHAG